MVLIFLAMKVFQKGTIPEGGGGALGDPKLAPRSKKKFPLKLILRSRIRPKTDTPF